MFKSSVGIDVINMKLSSSYSKETHFHVQFVCWWTNQHILQVIDLPSERFTMYIQENTPNTLPLGRLRDAMLKDSEALLSGTHTRCLNSWGTFIQCDKQVKQRLSLRFTTKFISIRLERFRTRMLKFIIDEDEKDNWKRYSNKACHCKQYLETNWWG